MRILCILKFLWTSLKKWKKLKKKKLSHYTMDYNTLYFGHFTLDIYSRHIFFYAPCALCIMCVCLQHFPRIHKICVLKLNDHTEMTYRDITGWCSQDQSRFKQASGKISKKNCSLERMKDSFEDNALSLRQLCKENRIAV